MNIVSANVSGSDVGDTCEIPVAHSTPALELVAAATTAGDVLQQH